MNHHDPLTIEEALDHGLAKSLLAHAMKTGNAYYAFMHYATCSGGLIPHDHVFYSWAHDVVEAKGHPALAPDDMRAMRQQYADLDLTDEGRAVKAQYVAEHEAYRQSARASV